MTEPEDLEDQPSRFGPAQWFLVAVIIAFSAGSLLYKILMHQHLGHSAAMFLGVPAVLAIILALTPKAASATGAILKAITLALLIIAPLLGEGYLCILFAAPLFYVVGIIIGLVVDYFNARRTNTLTCLTLILLPMCVEGVTPSLSFNRAQTVEAEAVVPSPAAAVEQALGQSPDVSTRLPHFLRIGFPQPLASRGDGLALGDTRAIHFAGAEGDPPGDLVLRVTQSRPGYARFDTVSDSTKLTQWVRWTSSEVEWRPLDPTHTTVTWRIHFDRQLDPAWYFTPWQRIAARQAAAYLIQANATPRKQ
ncbi:hypothetical protein [Granulicella sibirica]|uniref:Polyketide cyclase/dehydrase n=1 Tax=Granulicella sibirica TaxID=2479048 RepID=A0A4V1L577_9BACT|nr:hypothetical protein [Granulicella sibirica]RXH54804.1 hypothetical protein GRAN_3908 [Granulicella sibirica]